MFWLYKVALAQEQSKIEEKNDGSDEFSTCSFMFTAHFHVLYLSCHLQQEHLPNVIYKLFLHRPFLHNIYINVFTLN